MPDMSLKIIPPLQVLIVGALMWLVHRYAETGHHHFGTELLISRVLLIAALALVCTAVYQFWRHDTTINPGKLERTAALIERGVFAFSRNPIYVADVLILLAWAVLLGQWLNLFLILVFIRYITHYQILPEEAVLQQKFGDSYTRYCAQVRRWV